MYAIEKSEHSETIPFDNTGSSLTSTLTGPAIRELSAEIDDSSRSFTFASYGGNANAGRYLEIFPGIDTSEAPLLVSNSFKVLHIVSRTTAANATCTIGFYDIQSTPVLLYTTTFSAVKQVVETGTSSVPLFTLPSSGQLAIKIDSGSISKPHLYFTGQGG